MVVCLEVNLGSRKIKIETSVSKQKIDTRTKVWVMKMKSYTR